MEYVKNATGTLKKVMLCPPEHLELEPINVISTTWLKDNRPLDKQKCLQEHSDFVQAYRENGVEVVLVEPDSTLKYQVFARDFGACLADGYIAGRFREPCRYGESKIYQKKMKEMGIPVIARCTSGAFEGGDYWQLDDYTIVHGVIARTDEAGFDNIRQQISEYGYTMTSVQCHSRNLHLDMCFNLVAERLAVVCSEALPESFLAMLKKRKFELIDVSQEGVFRHYCNIQCLGDDRVISFKNNSAVNERLRSFGINVIEVEIEEILKAGGGPHCMTFPLLRT